MQLATVRDRLKVAMKESKSTSKRKDEFVQNKSEIRCFENESFASPGEAGGKAMRQHSASLSSFEAAVLTSNNLSRASRPFSLRTFSIRARQDRWRSNLTAHEAFTRTDPSRQLAAGCRAKSSCYGLVLLPRCNVGQRERRFV